MADSTQLLQRMMRKIDSMQRELTHVREIISADCRTADRLISVAEACTILGVKKSTVYEMIKSGELPARKEHGKRYRLSFNQVQQFINH